jgi:hypothetical protein
MQKGKKCGDHQCLSRFKFYITTLIFSLSIDGESNCFVSPENFSEICKVLTKLVRIQKIQGEIIPNYFVVL